MKAVVDFFVGFGLISWAVIYTIIAPFFPKKYKHKDVTGQVVLITGGGSGFGQLLAKKFSHEGATIVIWDMNKTGLQETVNLVKKDGGKIHSYVVDVTSRDQVYTTAKKVEAEVGKVDILINNAGIGDGELLLNTKDEDIEKIFNVNCISHFWTVKSFLPAMISKKRGHIVTISSSAGLFGAPRLTSYCATKHAVVGFDSALSAELAAAYPDSKIQTTVICPYFVRTPLIAGKEHLLPPSSSFLPIRDADPVVDEMVDAILSNENMLVPSYGIRFLVLLKSVIPTKVMNAIRGTFFPPSRYVPKRNK